MPGQSPRRSRKRPGKKGGQDECVGANPCDRGKSGVKKSLLVEGNGWPLAACISGANTPDAKLLALTLDAIVVERPQPTAEKPQHLCLDKGYDNPTGEAACAQFGYTPHIRRIGEEKLDAAGQKKHPARRWVVERTLAWLSRCRAVLVRYDKIADRYLAMVKLACALFWFRRWHTLSQKDLQKP